MMHPREKMLEILRERGPLSAKDLAVELFNPYKESRRVQVGRWLHVDEQYGLVKNIGTYRKGNRNIIMWEAVR